ncbi:ABC transporter transmembrane domain-containing protein [Synechococcus sp. C9]|uniref:ABC transporter transmembrane domain-containing protein n=1 Tax=Synechococcus sp. C9 TaxID=102119 RepID=UPI001FF254B3|nr:ABC transporter transmembrane domain-containing protein [Synechococcus sp. C9]
MTATQSPLQTFLLSQPFVQDLPTAAQQQFLSQVQAWKYRMGQPMMAANQIADHVLFLYQGSARSLFLDPRTQRLVTIQRFQPGDVVGWLGVLRGRTCETVIATDESIGLTIPADLFQELWKTQPSWQNYFNQKPTAVEIAEMIVAELGQRAEQSVPLPLKDWVAQLEVKLIPLAPGPLVLPDIPDGRWWVSLGQVGPHHQGSWLNLEGANLRVQGYTRLLGVIGSVIPPSPTPSPAPAEVSPALPQSAAEIPYAPAVSFQATDAKSTTQDYPYFRGEGELGGALACFQMVAKLLNIPFRRELLRRVLENRSRQTGGVNLQLAGAVAQLMGMDTQLLRLPSQLLTRAEGPALVEWQGKLVVLFRISPQEIVMGVPDQGILRRRPAELLPTWGDEVALLTLKKTAHTPQVRFGLSWFWPSIWRYRRVLLEVFIASFFVQLFSLANPLMIQIIIDKVLIQNSVSTLNVLGILLIGVAVAEAVLGAIRTYLFVDTTNRIDMALGSEVIDHLLRLPLRYYERRPVGELSTRVNELEHIRQFLTGTALTVVLDAVFSVVYIVVMQ